MERMKTETMRDELARAIAPRIADWVFGPDQLTDPEDSGAYDIADIALAALGLDDLDAFTGRVVRELKNVGWDGMGIKSDVELALEAALSATEGPQDG